MCGILTSTSLRQAVEPANPVKPERQLAAEHIEPIRAHTLGTVWTVRLDGPERFRFIVAKLSTTRLKSA